MSTRYHHRTSTLRRVLIAAWLIVTSGLASTVLAQSTTGAGTPSFGETLDVRVIEVQAVVTRGGDRISGLGADDFELRIDGERHDIEFFAEVRGGERYSATQGDSATRLTAEPGATRYVLFIDDDFALPNKRNRLLQNLEEQVDSLGAQDRMAVVAWNGEQVEMLSSWLEAGSDLRRVLRNAQDRTGYGLKRRSEFRRWESEQRSARSYSGSSFSSIGFAGANRANGAVGGLQAGSEASESIRRLSRAVSSALRGFAEADGRKVLLMLSGGLPSDGTRSAQRFRAFSYADTLDDVEKLFQPAVDTANLLGYTIYPVDMGESSYFAVSAEYGTLGQATTLRSIEDERIAIEEGALHFLADQTGGEVLFGGSGREVLERVIDDTRSYYVLGFTPDWNYDDKAHDVEVDVDLRGASGKRLRRTKVRTRRSFSDLSRESRVSMAVDSAHLFDLPLPEARGFEVALGEPTRVGVNKMDVPVRLTIPLEGVTFLRGDGVSKATLELRVAATDENGNAADVPRVPVVVERAPGDDTKLSQWETTLRLRRLPHRLLIAVHDPLSDVILARRLDVQP